MTTDNRRPLFPVYTPLVLLTVIALFGYGLATIFNDEIPHHVLKGVICLAACLFLAGGYIAFLELLDSLAERREKRIKSIQP